MIKVAGRLNENVSNKIFSQIVRTIDDLYYKHSIIHRDVKVVLHTLKIIVEYLGRKYNFGYGYRKDVVM